MELVTVGPKYQIVIPKKVRRILKDIKPGDKLGVDAISENEVKIKTVPKNWSDAHFGAFKKYWKGIDMIAHIEKGRTEWEERLKELDQIRQGKNPYGKSK